MDKTTANLLRDICSAVLFELNGPGSWVVPGRHDCERDPDPQRGLQLQLDQLVYWWDEDEDQIVEFRCVAIDEKGRCWLNTGEEPYNTFASADRFFLSQQELVHANRRLITDTARFWEERRDKALQCQALLEEYP